MTDDRHDRQGDDPTADNPGGADAPTPIGAPSPPPPRRRAVRPRNAASLIVWRPGAAGGEPELLMGMRHAKHRFMPSVLVFPGGAVDAADHRAPAMSELTPETRRRLEHRATPSLARALAVAAARELFEETGLVLGERRGEERIAPDLAALDYLCRAVTPPSRAIRFNARFLVASADRVSGEIRGSGELEELGWFPIAQALEAPLAPITRMMLGEVRDWLALDEATRAALPMIVYRGNDNRMQDG